MGYVAPEVGSLGCGVDALEALDAVEGVYRAQDGCLRGVVTRV